MVKRNYIFDTIKKVFQLYCYLPIETLSPRGKPYDPYAVVPAFLKLLRDAIAQTA